MGRNAPTDEKRMGVGRDAVKTTGGGSGTCVSGICPILQTRHSAQVPTSFSWAVGVGLAKLGGFPEGRDSLEGPTWWAGPKGANLVGGA